ncbi:MAG: intradiol ring-cleavage dioxygenase [Burkholderiaceae bacterium]|nr:intradiol ring-cleavage dioxygenase [Burkholderiaceae bacterium]
MRKRPNNAATLRRRQALFVLSALGAVPLARPTAAEAAGRTTPSQSLGPFYPRSAGERPRQTDADLLAFDGDRLLTRGEPLYLTGRALDRRGRPIAQAEVEIWQCDANAVYHHPAGGAEPERDPHFQGYGRAQTDADGRFHFRTIRPVAYPGRTPHIHLRIAPPGGGALATQLYLPDEPGNARDFLFRQLSRDEQAALTLSLRTTGAAHPLARGTRVTGTIEVLLG